MIATTDADCRPHPEWIATICSFMHRHPTDLLIGPVNTHRPNSFINQRAFGAYSGFNSLALCENSSRPSVRQLIGAPRCLQLNRGQFGPVSHDGRVLDIRKAVRLYLQQNRSGDNAATVDGIDV